jgi:hypothetical protein
MIVNQDLLIEHLAKWLVEYAKAAGRNVFVVGFRGCRSDALLLHICSKATEMYGGNFVTHALCMGDRVGAQSVFNGKITYYSHPFLSNENFYLNCHDIAENNGLVVGPVDRTFGLYYRSYGKRSDGSADVFPLFDLEYSDIRNIVGNLWPNIGEFSWGDSIFSTYTNQYPIADIEYANEAEALYRIITNTEAPNKHPRWPYFIANQKAIIALVWQREKLTRHKMITRPYPILSDKPQLCKRVGQ